MLKVGDTAPAFDSLDTQGQPISLAQFAGRPLVLYFYPKDRTPGCTTEARDFRDLRSEFEALGAAIVGVSRDSVASHQKFTEVECLPFNLIADTDESVCQAYGVIGEKVSFGKTSIGLIRTTYLIDAEGKIAQVWSPVTVKDHAAAVLEAVRKLA